MEYELQTDLRGTLVEIEPFNLLFAEHKTSWGFVSTITI